MKLLTKILIDKVLLNSTNEAKKKKAKTSAKYWTDIITPLGFHELRKHGIYICLCCACTGQELNNLFN